MKKMFLPLLVFLATFATFGQTKIDEIITINFPCKTEKKESNINNINILTYSGTDQEDIYTLQRIIIDSIKNDYNNLPSDLESLKKFYSGVNKGFTKGMTKAGYKLKESKDFQIDNYNGLQTNYISNESKLKVIECRFILLDEYLYSIMYVNATEFSELKKNNFLNSITINKAKKPSQYIENSTEYNLGYVLGQFTVYAVFVLGIAFLIKYLRKKKTSTI